LALARSLRNRDHLLLPPAVQALLVEGVPTEAGEYVVRGAIPLRTDCADHVVIAHSDPIFANLIRSDPCYCSAGGSGLNATRWNERFADKPTLTLLSTPRRHSHPPHSRTPAFLLSSASPPLRTAP